MLEPEIGSPMEIESLESWKQALQEIKAYGICGLSVETTGSDPLTQRIRLVLLSLPDGRLYFADIFDLGEKALEGLAELLEDSNVKKVVHNANFLLSFIRISRGRRLKFRDIFDLQLASQLCWSGYYDLVPSNSPKNPWKKRVPDHSLGALAERHLGILLGKSCQDWDWSLSNLTSEQKEYSTKRAKMLLPLHRLFQDLIHRNKLESVSELEFGTVSPVIEMALSGICFDSEGARALIAKKEIQLMKVFMDIQAEAKANSYCDLPDRDNEQSYYLNPDSQKDVKRFLKSQGFDVLSTRADVLHELARHGCRFAEMLLEYRRLCHDLAFLENWLMHLHSTDNRIHSSYYQLRSATGRLSSCRPSAQQIPSRGNDAADIRKLFSAAYGKKIVKADFSAIELRIMAYLSGDETMRKALQEGQDLHRLTASKISGLAIDQVTDQQRQAAKTINFLLIYGGSAKTLQWRALSDYGAVMSLDEAEEMRERFFETYPGIRAWQERQIAENSYTHQHYFHNCVHGTFALPLTCTFTAMGRRRVWPRFGVGIKASKFQLFNTPCQGTGADLIKEVMCEVYHRLSSEDARIIGSIHDEILLEVPEDEAEDYANMLCEVMNRVGSEMLYPIPVTSEATISSSW